MISAVVLAMGVLLASPSAEDVQRAVQDTLSDDAYQTEVPVWSVPPGEASTRRDLPDTSALRTILKALLYILLVVAVGLALFWIVQRFQDPRPPPDEAAEPVTRPTTPALSDQPLEDATTLAAEGRYTEAVHALLLRTLGILAENRTFPHSWTSREIVRRLELPEAGAHGLEDLVDAVEISFFGGREADAEDYERCVESFRRLQTLLQGGAA